ncbi:type IV pilus modification protein PilV [Luteibacter rhizovicinus]|uniref:Type IV pilus modification protein PilV n=1 Tax=Luteibacter rhizovicinus TaxID=242606 RepID=A0A4R3YWG6_9GAMM|nr:type IV pilus modification protein PilV [Luteibacter rhizovicinus]TCV97515.1 type IV pilus modification protein PilV [Luteibacter rhizovicinus]
MDNAQNGLSLIEVLVATVVLGLGLAAVLQGFRFATLANRDAMHRTQANFIAADMAGRLRINQGAARAGLYNGSLSSRAIEIPGCAATSPCDENATVGHDRALWIDMLFRQIGNGARANIACHPSQQTCDLSIGWHDVEGRPVELVWATRL